MALMLTEIQEVQNVTEREQGSGKHKGQGDRAKRDDRTKAQRWHMEAQRYTEELKLV